MVLKYSGISELYEIANKKPGPGLLFCFVFFTRFLGEFWYGWCLRTKIVGCRITLLQKVTVFFLSSVQFPTSGTSPKYLWEKPTLPSFHDSLSKIRASQVVLVIKNLPANSGDIRDAGSILGSRISPGEGNGNPLQYSCLENLMDRGACWATVRGVTKSRTQLSD